MVMLQIIDLIHHWIVHFASFHIFHVTWVNALLILGVVFLLISMSFGGTTLMLVCWLASLSVSGTFCHIAYTGCKCIQITLVWYICRGYELLVMASSLNFNSAYYGIVTNSSHNWKSKIKFSSCIYILLWVGPSSAKCLPYTLKVFISINVCHFFFLRKLILKVANFTKFLYNVIIEINPSS